MCLLTLLLFNPDSIWHAMINALPLHHLCPTATGQKGVQVPVTQHSRTWSSSDHRKKNYVPSAAARSGRRRRRTVNRPRRRCGSSPTSDIGNTISGGKNDATLVPRHVIRLRLKDSADLKHSWLCLRDGGLGESRMKMIKFKKKKHHFLFFFISFCQFS